MSLPPNTNTQELIRIEQLLDVGNYKQALQTVTSEIYKADLEKGQEFKGGGGGSSRSSGEYEEMYHISHYWKISPKKYVTPLFRGYMPRIPDQISKIAEHRRELQNRILEILYEFKKGDYWDYYQVSNFCSILGISEQELRNVLSDLRKRGYIIMHEKGDARLTSSGMAQIIENYDEDGQIQLKIIEFLYKQHLDNPNTMIPRERLLEELLVPENSLYMNIVFLRDCGQVELFGTGGGAVFDIALITSLGITVYEDYAQQPIDTDSPVASQLSGDVIISADLVEILPKEIQIDIIKAQTCFEFSKQSPHPIYEACAMYLQRVLATAIVIRFQRDGKDEKLYNKDHQPFKLKTMVKLAKQENYISSSLSKQLMRIKWMGDIGVHDYKIKLKETDIQPIFQLMRFTFEHLFYNNQN